MQQHPTTNVTMKLGLATPATNCDDIITPDYAWMTIVSSCIASLEAFIYFLSYQWSRHRLYYDSSFIDVVIDVVTDVNFFFPQSFWLHSSYISQSPFFLFLSFLVSLPGSSRALLHFDEQYLELTSGHRPLPCITCTCVQSLCDERMDDISLHTYVASHIHQSCGAPSGSLLLQASKYEIFTVETLEILVVWFAAQHILYFCKMGT